MEEQKNNRLNIKNINDKILYYFDIGFEYLKKYSIPTFKYILITIKHKIFVIAANFKYGIKCNIFRLIMHDLSKFRLFKETIWYGITFYGGNKKDEYDQLMFQRAWIHHQNSNDHHFEYWMDNSKTDGENNLVEIPEQCIREMICDWLASCRAYENHWPTVTGDGEIDWPWLNKNIQNIIQNKIHPKSGKIVVDILADCFKGVVIV